MSEWIKWEGGECPVSGGTRVTIMFDDGDTISGPAGGWKWNHMHNGHGGDIAAYRVETQEEAYEETDKPIGDSALSRQFGGDHYSKLGDYQPWEVLRRWLTPEEFRGYMKGTAITYLARERDKGGTQDIEKGMHTLQGLIELEGK